MSERNIRDVLENDGHKSGIVTHMPRAVYDSLKRMNFSTAKTGLVGVEDVDASVVKENYEGRRMPVSQDLQDSYDRGTLMHLILLQPEEIAGRVAVWAGKNRSGHEWDAFEQENAGKLIVRQSDVRDVQSACREFRRMPLVRDILKPCDTEVAVLVKEGNIYCKAMIDAVTREGDGLCIMLDPKSTRTGIDSATVMRTIRKLNYREQMGLYARWFKMATGREIDQVYLLFVSLPPQRIGVRHVRLTTSALQFGEARMLAVFHELEQCLAADEWPAFCADDICDVSEREIGDVQLEGFDE